LDAEHVVGVDRTLAEAVTGADEVALVDAQVLPDRNLVDPLVPRVGDDDHFALPALDVAEADGAVHLGDDGGLLRAACLEELRDPRTTAGDVAGLVSLARDLRERTPGRHRLSVDHGELRAHGHDELAELLPRLRVVDLDHRVELLRPVLDDHELTAAGRLVELLAHGLFLDDVDEAHHAAEVRDDRLGVRIPAEEQVSDLDLL